MPAFVSGNDNKEGVASKNTTTDEKNLSEANLYKADLSEADLSRVNLNKADLSKAYLSTAILPEGWREALEAADLI